jgi:hypothetical protein
MVQVNVKQRMWFALGLAACLVGCATTPQQPGPTTTEEAFGELAGVNCSAVRPKAEPALMAWDPGSRMNLNRLRKLGVVAVRYRADGCNVELMLLPDCIGTGEYEYEPYVLNDSKLLRNKQELFSELPLGAAQLAGKLARDRVLRTDYTLVGMAALPPDQVVLARDLKGPACAQATHVISRVYLGGFAMASGDQQTLSAQTTIFGASAGARQAGKAIRVTSEGSAEHCQQAQRTGQEQPLCAVPLRIGLTPVVQPGQSACAQGSVWDGERCVRGQRGPARLDPSPCLRGGNALYLHGDRGSLYSGQRLIQDGTFKPRGERDRVSLTITPSDTERLGWHLEFNTKYLGAPVEVRAYPGARRSPQFSKGPGLSVGGRGYGCNRGAGKFEVLAIEWSGEILKRFTAVFQYHCELRDTALRGCVHYEAPR